MSTAGGASPPVSAGELRQHPGGLTLYVFEPSQLGVALGRRRAGQVLHDVPEGVAFMAGPMWDRREVIEPRLLDLERGVDHPGTGVRRGKGLTIAVVAGKAVPRKGHEVPEGASVAVQGWPSLVEGTRNVAGTTGNLTEAVWRAALCIMADGRLAFAVQRAPLRAFASALIAAGAAWATYTDGGGSTKLLHGSARIGHPEDRLLGSWLVAERPDAPRPTRQPAEPPASPAGPLAPGVCAALYNGRRPDRALTPRTRRLLEVGRPGIVMVHGGPQALRGEDPAQPGNRGIGELVRELRAMLPGVELWLGVGADGWLKGFHEGRYTEARVVAELLKAADLAAELGCTAVCWDPEAEWKLGDRAINERIARSLMEAVAAKHPQLVQDFTSYDHPTYHSAFTWFAWLGRGTRIKRARPQVYAAGAGGARAARGALKARKARALASWQEAVRRGWITPDAPAGTPEDLVDVDWVPYVQAHSVPCADTVELAIAHEGTAFWAFDSRADFDGRVAFLLTCELVRRGIRGPAGIADLQHRLGIDADGRAGTEETGPALLGNLDEWR